MYNIAVIPGDGIGREVMEATINVLKSLDIDLKLFASTATRTNLRYSVIHADTDADKYVKLRQLVTEHRCPTIVYVSRTRRTIELATKLSRDGLKALPFNGKMNADEKTAKLKEIVKLIILFLKIS